MTKYDIKIYETKGKSPISRLYNIYEQETIRDLTESQKDAIVSVLKRHKIRNYVKELKNE